MLEQLMHPNSRILLDAWRRMAAHPDQLADGPQARDYPGLIDRLFVLRRTEDGTWVFSVAGDALSRLMGRALEEHDFLALWTGHDRLIAAATLESAFQLGEPGLIRLRGETLRGRRCDIEMPLAPLAAPSRPRMLGLYQSLGGEAMLKGRTIWRHRITSLVMPDQRLEEPRIKLVASND